MSSDSVGKEGSGAPAGSARVRQAVEKLRYGSVEVLVHDGRVVQVETREKVRFTDDRRPDDRGRHDRAAVGPTGLPEAPCHPPRSRDHENVPGPGHGGGAGRIAPARAGQTRGPPAPAADTLAGPPAPAADKPAAPSAEKKSLPVSAGSDGFSLQNESGDFRLQLRGYAQFDGRFFSGDEGALAINTFTLRRVRPIAAGHAREVFRVQHHARLRRRRDACSRTPGWTSSPRRSCG